MSNSMTRRSSRAAAASSAGDQKLLQPPRPQRAPAPQQPARPLTPHEAGVAAACRRLLFVLATADSNGYFLARIDTPEYAAAVRTPLAWEDMEARAYTTLSAFQDDFDTITTNARTFYAADHYIHAFARRLARFGSLLIAETAERMAAEGILANDGNNDDNNDGSESADVRPSTRSHAKFVESRSENEDMFRGQKLVLVRRNKDGSFLFSSTQKRAIASDERLELPKEVNTMAIVPMQSDPLSQVPRLAHVCPRAAAHTAKPERVPHKPVPFLDYGPNTSFAPAYDSGLASMPAHATRLAYGEFARQLAQRQHAQSKRQRVSIADVDLDALRKAGVEPEELFKVAGYHDDDEEVKGAPAKKKAVVSTADVIAENDGLIGKLMDYQRERFAQVDAIEPGRVRGIVDNVSKAEKQMAQKLLANLAELAPLVHPHDLVGEGELGAVMARGLRTLDAAFFGAIPEGTPQAQQQQSAAARRQQVPPGAAQMQQQGGRPSRR